MDFKIQFILFSILITIGFQSCNNPTSDSSTKDSVETKESIEVSGNEADIENTSPLVRSTIKRLDSLYSATPYYVEINGKRVFYVVKGEWGYEYNKKFNGEGKFKMGIVDDMLKEILPVEYDKIYNPDATVKGFIEVEKNGKIHLFNYRNYTVSENYYDVLFPSKDTVFLAIGKRDNQFYKLKKDFSEITSASNEYPAFSIGTLLDLENNDFLELEQTYMYQGDAQPSYKTIFTPSYINALELIDEVNGGIARGGMGIYNRIVKVENKITLSEKMHAFVVSFYEAGIGGRSYSFTKKSLVVVDEKQELKSRFMFSNVSDIDQVCGKDTADFIPSDILQVVKSDYVNNYTSYDRMPIYKYFRITQTGAIDTLKCNRIFAITKYKILEESDFKSCYLKFFPGVDPFDYSTTPDKENCYVSDYCTVADVNFMINEIYAEYSYKFKTTDVSEYFLKQPWYKPLYDDVEYLFSETDKKNIEFLKLLRDKLRANEQSYTNRRKSFFMETP